MRGLLRRLVGCSQRFVSSSSGRSSELGQTLMVSSAATVSYSTLTLMEKPNLLSASPIVVNLRHDFSSLHVLNHYRNFSAPSSSGPSNIVSIESEEQFNTSLRKVQDESLPAIFYFTAVWCGPCRLLSPVIGQLSEKYPHVTTYKIDIDKIISTVSIAINSKISNQKHTHLPLHPNWQMYTEYPCSHVFTRSLLSQ
ncbi:putative thioredoxin O1, mitochondrial-like isoform 2 [Capsicum annuum]|nr:putative thioredoxin O1, mitochondrial-like isoform 2 [Capsicum annuum]